MAAPSAGAAAFTVGDGEVFRPGIAVDPVTGVGHVTWGQRQNSPAPDLLQYCRIPRGASDCDRRQTIEVAPELEAFGHHQVLVPESGRVILLANRCCGKGEGVWMVESTDGGTSFGAPRQIGTGTGLYRAAFGPGEFNVSLTTDTDSSGVKYQSAPIDGSPPATSYATVGDGSGQWYSGSTAFLGPLTPMVAFDDLDNLFFRVKDPTAGSDPNDIANWKPTQALGKGDEPMLAGGPRGVYLLHSDDEVEQQYVVRGFDPATEQFGLPVAVSERGDPIFRDFMQDAGGGLNAAWISNTGTDPLRFRTSADGRDWGAIQTLDPATNDNGFNLRVGAASDGGGWVVFDGNSTGPIRLAPIPPRGPAGDGGPDGTPGCVPSLTMKKGIVAMARNGACIKKISGTRYGTDGEVRINGMDLIPAKAGGSRRARAAADAPIVLDTAKNTVSAEATVEVRAGEVVLDKSGVKWDLDVEVEFNELQKFDIKLFGFPITGEADVSFTPGQGVLIKANLGLPSFLSGTTGRVDLRANNAKGLIVDGLQIKVPYFEFGVAAIKDLVVTYQKAGDVFEGSAGVVLPPQEKEAIKFGFGLAGGKFIHAEAFAGPPLPPFPLAIVPTPPIFLNQVGIAVSAADGLKINGGVQLTGGPTVAGKALVSIDALPPKGFTLDFPASKPWAKFDLSGDVSLVGLKLGGGFISFRTDGLFEFGGSVGPLKLPPGLPIVRVEAGVNGYLNIGAGDWLLGGNVKVCAPASCLVPLTNLESPIQGTASIVGSSLGIIACVDVVGASIGASYRWQESEFTGYESGCDVESFKPVASSSRIRAAQAGVVQVRAGMPQVNFAFKGADAPPKVRLTEPGGRTIASDPSDPNVPIKGDGFVIWTVPEANLTYVVVADPKAGDWTVAAQDGSSPIVETRTANGLPEPSVKSRVAGRGHSRTLRYDVRRINGQRVTFIERMGSSVGRKLGAVAGGGSGSLKFRPGFGPAGRREIVALVEQDGKPRETQVVASYTAPRPLLPTKPGRVRVKRMKRGAVRVTWGAARRAKSYDVTIKLSDGRREIFKARKRTLTLRGVDSDVRGTIAVNAQGERLVDGPRAVARLKRVSRRSRRR